MADEHTSGQREHMRRLVAKLGRNQDAVCAAYADAERSGLVMRAKNTTGHSPEEYALALWRDGERKGWL
ncbi:hypothetical protein GCM10010837_18110 [Aminobacter niigataensis]